MSGANQHDLQVLSKSAFVAALRCPKLVWKFFHAPEGLPKPDQVTQARFEEGHELGRLARALFADGIEVMPQCGAGDLVQEATQRLLQLRRPLFEAGFLYEGTFARVDILHPVGSDAWDVYEVKGCTSLEESHIAELAFEARALAGAGVRLHRFWLVYLNDEYVRRGPIDVPRLFVKADCTQRVSMHAQRVEQWTDDAHSVIKRPACPEVVIGVQCDQPNVCPLRGECWNCLPNYNVTELYRGKRKGFRLLQSGVERISEIPENGSLTARQAIQRKTIRTGIPHVEPETIKAFLRQLAPPIAFVDFETFSTGVPRFDGLKPYQRVPFQFSLHTLSESGATPEHCEFLAEGTLDPRREFMEKLQDAIPEAGSIVAYNAVFELGVLTECAEALPQYENWVRNLKRRFIDLLQPFRSFAYYHHAQRGSASMKSVLPAITGRGYEDLAIRDGETASIEFLRVTFGQVTPEERQRVRSHLLRYCGLDTLGMIQIVEGLRKAIGEN
jgi:hypothetical protein